LSNDVLNINCVLYFEKICFKLVAIVIVCSSDSITLGPDIINRPFSRILNILIFILLKNNVKPAYITSYIEKNK
jgi:hypothetical protein